MSVISLKNRTILQGDILEKLVEIPDGSIDCVISSPPYWGLRDYGVSGQLGLEPDFKDYLKIMQKVMDQLKRVLKDTGSCWINLGDTYAGGNNHSDWSGSDEKFDKRMKENQYKAQAKRHLPAKTRYGIPERFYIDCIDNGWLARNHIPWYKANSMPSPVRDRFTNKWESVFFFTKQQKYYFNLDAVREKTITEMKTTGSVSRNKNTKHTQEKLGGEAIEKESTNKQDTTLGPDGKPISTYKGFNERWNNKAQDQYTNRILEARANGAQHDNPLGHKSGWDENGNCYGCGQPKSKHHSAHDKNIHNGDSAEYTPCNPKGKNPGDMIFIDKTKPYAVVERYGTVYYRDLPSHNKIREYLNKWRKESNITVDELERQFDNYTPHHWFEKDGSYPTREDWFKVKQILDFDDTYDNVMTTLYSKPAEKQNNPKGKNPGDVFFINPRPFNQSHFATFPPELPEKIIKCSCPDNGFVLDPFFGSGTVGLVAEKLNRQWIGIELNPEYIEIANNRISPYINDKLEKFT